MTEPQPATGASGALEAIDWRLVLRGALYGLAVIVPVTVLRAILDSEVHDFDDSGWIYPLFVLILVAYGIAGWVVGKRRPDAPLSHGALAGIGAFVLWVPIRVVIWAVREDGRALFSGDKAALSPGQVFGQLVIAAAIGMLGAAVAARITRRAPSPSR
jgi:hypothetical protein